MNRSKKLFVGARVRSLREQNCWSQGFLGERLGVSLSYVSQIENNQRPVTASVLLKLAEVFGGGVAQFSEDQDRRQLAELDNAMRDQRLRSHPLSSSVLTRMVEQAPELVDTFLALYQKHTRLQDEYAQTLDRFYGERDQVQTAEHTSHHLKKFSMSLPQEEVRDYLNRRNNYLDGLDRLAESLVARVNLVPGQRAIVLGRLLRDECHIDVEFAPSDEARTWLRRYDDVRKKLSVPAGLTDAQQAFQLATQYALLVHADVIDEELASGGFSDVTAKAMARQAFAHYFAGAVILPYIDFLQTAKRYRYDIELLQDHFQTSFETVCHRLSTMQRGDARGIPFYFVRLDQAGNISKRQSATAFHFARYGGACPLWHVHEAFAQPERILTQVLEMPDGGRFFGIARTTTRGGGGFKARRKHFAIGLGCELKHAHQLVYADGISIDSPKDVVPIGPGCRVCPRPDCVQRAFPPGGHDLLVDDNTESLVSFRFEEF